MALVDNEFRFITANEAYLKAFDLTHDQIQGKMVSDILGEDFFDTYIKHHATQCLKGETVHFQNWTDVPAYGKSYMDITYSPYYGVDRNIKGYTVSGKNITKRKIAEDELKKQQEKLEEKVADRTSELQTLLNTMSGRELRMIELKKVIEKLRRQLKDAGLKPVADDPLNY